MLSSIYTLDLNQAVLHSLATISKFDGTHPSMACGTVGGKVFIHSPHSHEGSLSYLNINKTIVCMKGGSLDPDLNHDVLIVGSPSSLMAYDVFSNVDVFNSDVRDGVYSMTIGKVDINSTPTNVALIGGNCSVLGFNKAGEDVFWTVSGDNVSALSFFLTEKNDRRILVGSEDYAIRIYNNEEMLFEINETAKVTNFCELGIGKYGYSLDSGGVGVYKGTHRMWKAKAKHKVISMEGADILGDGVPALLLGWSNGKIEVRSERKGEELFKKMLKQPIAKVFYDDYRLEGKKQVIGITTNGKIVGFAKETAPQAAEPQKEEIEDLQKQKISLLNELQSIKDPGTVAPVMPNLALTVSFEPNPTSLVLSSNNNSYIKCALLLSEGLFENDTKFCHPSKVTNELKIPIKNNKFQENEIDIKALIGPSPAAVQYQVFERRIKLPKYTSFLLKPSPAPSGSVAFEFIYGTRISDWIRAKFLVTDSEMLRITDGKYCFTGETENLHIYLNDKTMNILTETIELAGEIIQDLAGYFGIIELNSRANFAEEIKKIKDLLEKIEDYNSVRTQLTVNMAENCQNVKTLVVKAEDARIQKTMTYFKQNLSNLHQFNGELLGEYQIRANNHTELLNCLKAVNQYIQRAGNLRCGSSKNKTISMFREGVKNRNFTMISQAISNGG